MGSEPGGEHSFGDGAGDARRQLADVFAGPRVNGPGKNLFKQVSSTAHQRFRERVWGCGMWCGSWRYQ